MSTSPKVLLSCFVSSYLQILPESGEKNVSWPRSTQIRKAASVRPLPLWVVGGALMLRRAWKSPACQLPAAVLQCSGGTGGIGTGCVGGLEECQSGRHCKVKKPHRLQKSNCPWRGVLDHPSILTPQGPCSHVESHLVTVTKKVPGLASSSDCRLRGSDLPCDG